ncbi:MAG: hydroxymethylbilane synthase [Planctomycetota bacterium]|nr:hydroxymethylbilane synthase [Planctomycetota bacterium]
MTQQSTHPSEPSEGRVLKLGTRGSALAMVQARDIARQLTAAGYAVEVIAKQTIGDQDKQSSFAAIGPPGVFVREIETALMEGELDLAVHCYKDLPSVSPEGLVIAAVPRREDAGELLLTRGPVHVTGEPSLPLHPGAVIGTSAARRKALIHSHRPDLVCRELRGNVPTRIRKLREGQYDAIVLAAAGLNRLREAAERGENEAPELDGLVVDALCIEAFVPAASQGALALQTRGDDAFACAAVGSLNDADSMRSVAAERELLARVQAGCEAPFGAHCRPLAGADDGSLELLAVFEMDGIVRRARSTGQDPTTLAREAFAGLGLA